MKRMLLTNEIKNAFDDNLLLLVHHHADVDSVASAIALKTVFRDATICASKGVSSHARKIIEITKNEILEKPPNKWDGTVVVLDCPNPERCAPVPISKKIVVIDHHNKIIGWPKDTMIIHQPQKTSTAEIVLSIIKDLGLNIDKCATVLLTAIYTDTGQFRHANKETFEAANELCDAGANPQEIINILDSEKPTSQKIASLKAAQGMKWTQKGKWIIANTIVSSFESSSARLIIVLGADIAIVGSSNKKGEMRISTRASNRIVSNGFNLNLILEHIVEINGGSSGGHSGAAGYYGRGDPEAISNIVKEKCVSEIKKLP